jgi:hypothetical protein
MRRSNVLSLPLQLVFPGQILKSTRPVKFVISFCIAALRRLINVAGSGRFKNYLPSRESSPPTANPRYFIHPRWVGLSPRILMRPNMAVTDTSTTIYLAIQHSA